jgi:hypothetical protein
MLMTFELSGSIKQCLKAHHDFARRKAKSGKQLDAAMAHKGKIQSQISSRNTQLAILARTGNPPSEKEEELKGELEILENMLQGAKNRRQGIHANIQWRGEMLRRVQEQMNAHIEEAFICARLVDPEEEEPPMSPIKEYDIQKEYQDYRLRILLGDVDEEMEEAVPLQTEKPHLQAEPLTAEQQRILDLRNAYARAEQHLEGAQAASNNRESKRAMEWQSNFEAAQRGEVALDATPADFDLRGVLRTQQLTRDVIEAENALTEAKAALLKAGVSIDRYDQASGFADDAADGYRISFEQDMVESVPQGRIQD